MTQSKTQYKKQIKNLYEKLDEIKLFFEDLKNDLESEAADVEPYENRTDLTDAQNERVEWLENAAAQIDYAVDNIQSALDDLDNIE